MNTYSTSKGERITKAVIDRNIRKAKEIKKRTFKNINGYVYCEFTHKSSGTRIDIMHLISVDECQKMGMTELSWDQRNLRFGTRAIHNLFDKQTHEERIRAFEIMNELKLSDLSG